MKSNTLPVDNQIGMTPNYGKHDMIAIGRNDDVSPINDRITDHHETDTGWLSTKSNYIINCIIESWIYSKYL